MSWFEDDFYAKEKSTSKQKPKVKGMNEISKSSLYRLFSKLFFLIILSVVLVAVVIQTGSLHNGVYSNNGKQTVQHETEKPMEPSLSGQNDSLSAIRATETVTPSVVSVLSFIGEDTDNRQLLGIGSGVIYHISNQEIKIITNSHVVDSGNSFQVVSYLGDMYEATLIGKDALTDLAVLQIKTNELQDQAQLGDSDQLQIGETVIALGNSLGLGYAPTVTKGIVSSLNRIIPVSTSLNGPYDWEMEVIQTDAAINQGNSGGPLINLLGEVIGINSSKIANTGVEGLGFSIPINDVKPIIEQLEEYGKVKRAMMGVVLRDLQEITNQSKLKLPQNIKQGVVVLEATGPALEAGIEINDVIVKLDNYDIQDSIDLRKYLFTEKQIGDTLLVTFYRQGKEKEVVLKLMER